jgi:ribosomal protein L37AE/L43A
MAIATRNQSHRCSICLRRKGECVEQLGAGARTWVCRSCAEAAGQLRLPIEEVQDAEAEVDAKPKQ